MVADLSVGENLQDHVVVSMMFGFPKIDGHVDFSQMLDNIYHYFKNRTGPYSAPQSPDFNGFINTRSIDADHPDIQTQHLIFERNSPDLRRELLLRGYQRKYINQLMEFNRKMTLAIVFVILTNPKSTGTITLRSKDVEDHPIIVPNYFSAPEDLATVVRGLRIYNNLLKTRTFNLNSAKFIEFDDYECEDYPSDSYWECHSRHFSNTLYHPTGTTKMGPTTDRRAVVDPQLRVHGVNGLRVCDAGIQPNIVTVNTNPSTIMIGERCAEFINDLYSD